MNRLLLLLIPLMLFGCGDSSAFQAPVSVPNGTGAQVRSNMNNALQAITTEQSGASSPATTYPYQKWVDTSTTPPTERIRNAANTAWVTVGTVSDTAYTAGNATTLQNLLPSADANSYIVAVTGSNGRLAWGMKPAFRGAMAYGVPADIFSGGAAALHFSATAYDTDNIHSTVSNTQRLVVPSGVTKVRLTAQAYMRGGPSGAFLAIYRYGSAEVGRATSSGALANGESGVINISSPVIPVTAGDAFELTWGPLSAGIYAAPGADTTWFAMEIIE